ncbi:MAG: hypothetical protein ACREEM_41995, partial [Blastocatellia bacterium]
MEKETIADAPAFVDDAPTISMQENSRHWEFVVEHKALGTLRCSLDTEQTLNTINIELLKGFSWLAGSFELMDWDLYERSKMLAIPMFRKQLHVGLADFLRRAVHESLIGIYQYLEEKTDLLTRSGKITMSELINQLKKLDEKKMKERVGAPKPGRERDKPLPEASVRFYEAMCYCTRDAKKLRKRCPNFSAWETHLRDHLPGCG